MFRMRHVVSAIVAASVFWAGGVAAEPAHAHALGGQQADAVHALAINADADHFAISEDHQHDEIPGSDDPSGNDKNSDHDIAVFHVHAPCFIAIAVDQPVFGYATVEPVVLASQAIVSVLAAAIAPPDRPPRIFL